MDPTSQRRVAVMESCFAAIAAQDADRLVTHYTEDYVLELPYYKPDESLVVEGREAVHGYLAGLAGKRVFAHQMPVDDLANSGLPGAELLRSEFRAAIEARRFAVIVDSTSGFLEQYPDDRVLKEHYQVTGPAFEEPRVLVPRSGWQVSPGKVWAPREAALNSHEANSEGL